MKKPELLAPAGNLEKLKLAIMYGADAVFLGGQEYGLRSNQNNFTIDEIAKGVEFAKIYNAKVYVTTNIYAHQKNFIGYEEFVQTLEKIGVTGIIVSDPGYIMITKKVAKNLEIHISTQQSITNLAAVEFYEQMGVDRCVLARELNFREIKEITNNCQKEIEVFIHGAVCSSYSGRCTLSNHMTGRDSNRGGCCQSCRWEYQLQEKNNGQFNNVKLNNPNKLFSMSVADMQLINYIPEIFDAGIHSLKIEGRMKSNHYVATIVRVYRKAIDQYYNNPKNYVLDQNLVKELKKAEARKTYEGSLIGDFSEKGQIFEMQYNPNKEYEYCGIVLEYDEKTKIATIEQRNFFQVGDELEFFGPNNQQFMQKIDIIYNEKLLEIKKANHPMMIVKLKMTHQVDSMWLVRRKQV